METMKHEGGRIVPTGVMQEVNATRQRHARDTGNAAYDYAVKSQTHLWVVLISHFATDAMLDAHDGIRTEPPILDADSMAGAPSLGCYVCEQPYERRLRHRKCPGEPK